MAYPRNINPMQDPIAHEMGGCYDYENDTADDQFERRVFNPPVIKQAQAIGHGALIQALAD